MFALHIARLVAAVYAGREDRSSTKRILEWINRLLKKAGEPRKTGQEACPTTQRQQFAGAVGQASKPVWGFFSSLLKGAKLDTARER